MKPEIKKRIEQMCRGEVPEGYKATKIAIFPKEWKAVRLKTQFIRQTRKNTEGNTNVLTISAQHGLISQEDFFSKSVASENKENYYLLYRGDFAYNKSYSNGYSYGAIKTLKLYEKGVVSPLYICFSKTKENECPEFYTHYFEAGMLNHEIQALAQEGARNHGLLNISIEDFFNAIIVKPPLAEQQRIATILTTLDKMIELKEKRLAEKQRQKKYLMQQLLTGKKRLPGFSGAWKENRLYNIAMRHTKRNNIGNTNVLTISAQYGLINQAEFFNKAVASDDKSNYFLLEKGDFAYNKSYSNGYPFGAIKRLTRYDVGIVSPLYICFRIKEGSVSGEYLEQYFEAGLMNHEIQAFAQEGARNHGLLNIAVDDFFNSKILLPSPEEQTAIAEVLSASDREIGLLRQDIEHEKQKKKALMQLLLTGIVRVKV